MPHKISIVNDRLVVEFEGLEEIAAIKKRLEFNLKNVVSVSTETRRWIEGIRVGGTGLPGVIKEGRYMLNGKKAFFAMRDPDKCITIEFAEEPYTYLVVQVDDKEKVAEEISNRLKVRDKA
jgi:hypothetical protein